MRRSIKDLLSTSTLDLKSSRERMDTRNIRLAPHGKWKDRYLPTAAHNAILSRKRDNGRRRQDVRPGAETGLGKFDEQKGYPRHAYEPIPLGIKHTFAVDLNVQLTSPSEPRIIVFPLSRASCGRSLKSGPMTRLSALPLACPSCDISQQRIGYATNGPRKPRFGGRGSNFVPVPGEAEHMLRAPGAAIVLIAEAESEIAITTFENPKQTGEQ